MPSNYRSDISLVDPSGKVLAAKRITVNDPLQYGGITFYQASFGDAGSDVEFSLVDLSRPDFPVQRIRTAVGRTLQDAAGNKLIIQDLRQHNVVNMSEDPKKQNLRDVGASLDITYQSPASGGSMTFRVYYSYPYMLDYFRVGENDRTFDDLGFSPGDPKAVELLSRFFTQMQKIPGELTPDQRREAFGTALKETGLPMDKAAQFGPIMVHAADVLKRHKLPVMFAFQGYDTKMFTGLQVARDPGSPLVWIGSALMVLGLIYVVYIPERRLWVRRRASGAWEVCGTSGRRSDVDVDFMVDALKNELEAQPSANAEGKSA
jgi:cytochrome c biogenesis protein